MNALEQLSTFYSALEENAEPVGENKLYRGFTTDVFKLKGLPIGSYSKRVQQMIDMGCITILRQGAIGTPSEWVLHVPPSEELYTTTLFSDGTRGYIPTIRRVNALEKRVEQIERILDLNGKDEE